MKRRTFVVICVAGVAGLEGVLLLSGEHASHRQVAFDLREWFEDPEFMIETGRRFVEGNESLPEFNLLIDYLLPSEIRQHWQDMDGIRLHGILKGRHEKELVREEVEQVNGWILSRTEAYLCAVFYLASVSV